MGEPSNSNFSSCCRLCLSEKLGTLKSIFEDASRSRQIVKNIRMCLGVEIHSVDKISTMICEQCLAKVNGWCDYRKFCHTNQSKLSSWFTTWNSSNIGDTSIQIKDEVQEVDEDQSDEVIEDDDDDDDDDVVAVKEEHNETYDPQHIEEIDDYPPPLTPHPPDEQFDRFSSESDDESQTNSTSPLIFEDVSAINGMVRNGLSDKTPDMDDLRKNCRICDKLFSTPGNRRKHENTIHHLNTSTSKENNESLDVEATGISPTTETTPVVGSDSEIQKIQFAAGLKLQQRPTIQEQIPAEHLPLTKIEIGYLDKCKIIIRMTETLTCACHNDPYKNIADLFTHLKRQRSWFAMFTCYNCLITFNDRSSYMKHYNNCPREILQNLKRLADIPVDPEVKSRLYQSYKCVTCNCIFSFHEDYIAHFDTEHADMFEEKPCGCTCKQTFDSEEKFKQHIITDGCYLKYFCDICFGIFSNMAVFKSHCQKEHDLAESNSLEAYDSYHKQNSLVDQPPISTSGKRSLPLETEVIPVSKRRRTVNIPPQLEPENANLNSEPRKLINPHALRRLKQQPSDCPDCDKSYSSYHNMVRHFRQFHDKLGNILICIQCPQKFVEMADLKRHEEIAHPVESSDEPLIVNNQFKFSCPECGDLFRSIEEWKKHIEKHPKKSCSECGKKFSLQTELDQHRSAHLNIKVYRDAKTKGYKSTMVNTLVCEICDKGFNTKSELRQHKLLHEKMPVLSVHDAIGDKEEKKMVTNNYSCVDCNLNFTTYREFWQHHKMHHANPVVPPTNFPHKCEECSKVVTTKAAWGNHRQKHERQQLQHPQHRPYRPRVRTRNDDSESYYTCKKCFKVFSSKSNHRNHMKCHGITKNAATNRSSSKTGKVQKTYWCDVCHQACSGLSQLQEHKQTEHVKEKVQNIPTQIVQHEPKKPFIFTCNICTLTFSSNFALRRHKEKHAMEETNKAAKQIQVYCKFCKISFQGLDKLNAHMKIEHDEVLSKPKPELQNPVKRFTCSLCKKMFDNANALSSHQGWHKRGKFGKKSLKTTPEKPKPSNQAPKRSNSVPKLLKPVNQCLTCSQNFPTDTALQIHVLAVHRNVDATVLHFKCKQCNLSFETKSSYDSHMQLHEMANAKPVKPHPCRYCSAGFSRSDTLNLHVRQHHKEFFNDIYKCNQCERSFDKPNALTIHLKVHDKHRISIVSPLSSTKPKPIQNKNVYFCSICDVGFTIAKDLRTHVITAHPF